jgi:hypothetical protein
MAGKAKYKNLWMRENRDRFTLIMPKGQKEKAMEFARSKGMNLSEYINDLIRKDMSADDSSVSASRRT